MEYPKINSLFKREGCGVYDESKHRYVSDLEKRPRKSPMIFGEYSCPEFESISRWLVDEKIDGTNIRVIFTNEIQSPIAFKPKEGPGPFCADSRLEDMIKSPKIAVWGRTKDSLIPCHLLGRLQELFTLDKLVTQFPDANKVVLFGEGFGPKIQQGDYYSATPDFVLFDIWLDGWWLEKEKVYEIAMGLGLEHDLNLGIMSTTDIISLVKAPCPSGFAEKRTGVTHQMEGIVARSYPQMLFRQTREPIMFKLKHKDFKEQSHVSREP